MELKDGPRFPLPETALLLLLLLTSGRAGAQGVYVPRPPEPDTVLIFEEDRSKMDRRISPRDAVHAPNQDPHVPNPHTAAWGSRDYFAISSDVGLQSLIVTVENGHLGSKTNPRGFWPVFMRGQNLLAVNELKYVLGVFPNHPRALQLLNMMARKMSDWTIPIAFYEKAIRLFPQHAYTYAQYGAYLVEAGEKVQGMRQLEKALSMNPELLFARAWMDRARRELGMPQSAEPQAPASTSDLQLDGIYVPRR